MIHSPKYFDTFIDQTAKIGINTDYDPITAAHLRILARIKTGGILLLSGLDCVIYAPWLMDSMSMTTRLIVHVNSGVEFSKLNALFRTDIRVAAHVQETDSFLLDLSKYYFDLIVMDSLFLNDALFKSLSERLDNDGAMAIVGSVQNKMQDSSGQLPLIPVETYVTAPLGERSRSMIISRVGEQQAATRKGGRSGRRLRSVEG